MTNQGAFVNGAGCDYRRNVVDKFAIVEQTNSEYGHQHYNIINGIISTRSMVSVTTTH